MAVQLAVGLAAEPAAKAAAPDHLLIHQVYGGGGKGDTPFTHSFIELYNPTAAEVDVTGWKIEYASSRGATHAGSTVSEWVYKDLSGTIPAYSSYLIRGAAETTTATVYDIDTYDLEWADRYIDNDQYNVRLVNAGATVDQVTVKEAGKDGGEGAAIAGISKQKSVRRDIFKDTNDNAADFKVLTYQGAAADFVAANRPRSLADGPWGLNAGGGGTPGGGVTPGGGGGGMPDPVYAAEHLTHLGSYSTGYQDEDGGVAEIVKYNPDNRKMYLVNGKVQQIDIVSLANVKNGGRSLTLEKRIDVRAMIPGFTFGDMTSIDVNPTRELIAVAVQEADYTKPGAVLLLDYDGTYVHHIPVGVQPDMVAFTPDGNYVLTADEGEPRNGYGAGAVDPKGSVSVVDLRGGAAQAQATIVTFDAFDAKREQLVADKVILKKGAAPSVDLEPEYIAIAPNGKTAYVTLQEANAIATLDIESRSFAKVKGLGFKDHSLPGNELDLFRDATIDIKNESVFGVYMPDGAAAAEIDGKTYLITANEGDAREWGDYENVDDATIGGKKFDALANAPHDGLEEDKTYILGGRSFSIWDGETLALVSDSGGDFEKIAADKFPSRFNVSNDNVTLDHRSSKKGPEPEDVKITEIDGKMYAAIGLERIGGVMLYDITDPTQPMYFDYANTRDYSSDIAGDVSPEGLHFVKATESPTGYPLLLAAHEVSGTVAVYEFDRGYAFTLRVLHTNDTHAHVENAARRVTAIQQRKTDRTLVLDAGDVFSGTLYFTKFEGLADREFMNMIPYDAMVPGNHEFDRGPETFGTFVKGASFPIVSANIDYSGDAGLSALYNADIGGLHDPIANGSIYASVVKDVYGESVGIFGLTTVDTKAISSPGETIQFQPHVERAQAEVERLKAAGVNKIVALSHLGYDVDLALAEAVPDIDIIVGGHSHTKLVRPTVVDHGAAGVTLVVQTGEYGANVGQLDATFDAAGQLTAWNGKLLDVATFAADPAAYEKFKTYEAQILEMSSQVIGKTDVELVYASPNTKNGQRLVRKEETNLGNLIADGILAMTKEKVAGLLSAEELEGVKGYVAAQNGGGIRAPIARGDITLGSLLEVMPYNNMLVALKVTGDELIAALENGVASAPAERGGFLHVAGMKFWYDSKKPAQTLDTEKGTIVSRGERVVRVEILQEDGSYEPIDPNAYYIFGTNSFAADGGDFFYSLKQAKADKRYYELFMPDYEVFMAHLARVGTVIIGKEGRINDLQSDNTAPVWSGEEALTYSNVTETSARLSWPVASDDNGYVSYEVLRNASKIATVDGTQYTVTGLSEGATVTFAVYAVDLAGNLSAPKTATLTTPSDSDSGSDSDEDSGSGAGSGAGSGSTPTNPASADGSIGAAELTNAFQKNARVEFEVTGETATLPASALVAAAGKPGATVVIKNEFGSYELPLAVLNFEALANELGVDLEDMSFTVEIKTLTGDDVQPIEDAIDALGGTAAAPVVDFAVTAKGNGKSVVLKDFGSVYVARTINGDDAFGVRATGVLYNAGTKKFTFVPSTFAGRVATLKSTSNSIYTVVELDKSFDDVTGAWSERYVEAMANKLIVEGYEDGRFLPNRAITRAEFAALVVRALGLGQKTATADFSDVNASAWYANDVAAAAQAGIVKGYAEDGTFRPNAHISRKELAAMVVRASAYAGTRLTADASALASFQDAGQLDWAQAEVSAAVRSGIVNGLSASVLAPNGTATRAEAATMLYRFLRNAKFIDE